MKNLTFTTNWQYTPYLDGTELQDGTLVDLVLSDGTPAANVKIEIETEYTDIQGVKIPRKIPFAPLPDGRRIKLDSKNSELQRC